MMSLFLLRFVFRTEKIDYKGFNWGEFGGRNILLILWYSKVDFMMLLLGWSEYVS
jgi:hypothetical protein